MLLAIDKCSVSSYSPIISSSNVLRPLLKPMMIGHAGGYFVVLFLTYFQIINRIWWWPSITSQFFDVYNARDREWSWYDWNRFASYKRWKAHWFDVFFIPLFFLKRIKLDIHSSHNTLVFIYAPHILPKLISLIVTHDLFDNQGRFFNSISSQELKKTNGNDGGRENNEILFFEDLLIEISNYYLSCCSQDPIENEEEEEKMNIKSKNDQKNERNSSSTMMKGWKGLLYLDLKVLFLIFLGWLKFTEREWRDMWFGEIFINFFLWLKKGSEVILPLMRFLKDEYYAINSKNNASSKNKSDSSFSSSSFPFKLSPSQFLLASFNQHNLQSFVICHFSNQITLEFSPILSLFSFCVYYFISPILNLRYVNFFKYRS